MPDLKGNKKSLTTILKRNNVYKGKKGRGKWTLSNKTLMIMNKRKKNHKRSNNKMRILNKDKFKIIFQNLNRKNMKNT